MSKSKTETKIHCANTQLMKEEDIQQSFIDWVKLQHPSIIIKADLSGIKLPKGYAAKLSKSRSSAGFCDVDILEPNKHYHGLYMEFKRITPYKLDGTLKKMKQTRTVNGIKQEYDHLQEQQLMIDRLNEKGYFACFVWSVDKAINLLNRYLKNDKTIWIDYIVR